MTVRVEERRQKKNAASPEPFRQAEGGLSEIREIGGAAFIRIETASY
jgi:hypothetical protein